MIYNRGRIKSLNDCLNIKCETDRKPSLKQLIKEVVVNHMRLKYNEKTNNN